MSRRDAIWDAAYATTFAIRFSSLIGTKTGRQGADGRVEVEWWQPSADHVAHVDEVARRVADLAAESGTKTQTKDRP